MSKSQLEHHLQSDGLINSEELNVLARTPQTFPWAFIKTVLRMGILDEMELSAYISSHTDIPIAPRGFGHEIDTDVFKVFPKNLIPMLEAVPLGMSSHIIEVCVLDPLDDRSMSLLEFFLKGYDIAPVIASPTDLYEAIRLYFPDFIPSGTLINKLGQNEVHAATTQPKKPSRPKTKKVANPKIETDIAPSQPLVVEGFEDISLEPLPKGEDPFDLDGGFDSPPPSDLKLKFEDDGEVEETEPLDVVLEIDDEVQPEEDIEFDTQNMAADDSESGQDIDLPEIEASAPPNKELQQEDTVEYAYSFDGFDEEAPDTAVENISQSASRSESPSETIVIDHDADDLIPEDFDSLDSGLMVQKETEESTEDIDLDAMGVDSVPQKETEESLEDIDLDSFISESLENSPPNLVEAAHTALSARQTSTDEIAINDESENEIEDLDVFGEVNDEVLLKKPQDILISERGETESEPDVVDDLFGGEPNVDLDSFALNGLEQSDPPEIKLSGESITLSDNLGSEVSEDKKLDVPDQSQVLSAERKSVPQEAVEGARFAAIINQTLMKLSMMGSRKAGGEALKKQLEPLNINLSFKLTKTTEPESYGGLKISHEAYLNIVENIPKDNALSSSFNQLDLKEKPKNSLNPENNCYYLTLSDAHTPQKTIVTLCVDSHLDSEYHRTALLNISKKLLSLPDI